MIKELLKGYDSEENSFLQDDYPYGRKTRTERRVWIETTKRGDRFCAQTRNPKTNRWNKPKKSTYSDLMFMFLDENEHVKFAGYSLEWSDLAGFERFARQGDLDLVHDSRLFSYHKKVRVVEEARKHVRVEIKPLGTTEIGATEDGSISLTSLMKKEPETVAKADRIKKEQEENKKRNQDVVSQVLAYASSVVE